MVPLIYISRLPFALSLTRRKHLETFDQVSFTNQFWENPARLRYTSTAQFN